MNAILYISEKANSSLKAMLGACKEFGFKIATAESLTAGGIGFLLSQLPGSSNMLDRGFIVYNDEAKAEILGVDPYDIKEHSAVSFIVASQMAIGALKKSSATFSVAVTGYADDSPQGGTVYIATAFRADTEIKIHQCVEHHFTPDRGATRESTIEEAINALAQLISYYLAKHPSTDVAGQLDIKGEPHERVL